MKKTFFTEHFRWLLLEISHEVSLYYLCDFVVRDIKIAVKIAYHVWEAGYLADQANIKWTYQKKKKRYNNVYNTAMFLFIALADKGYIGDIKETVSNHS